MHISLLERYKTYTPSSGNCLSISTHCHFKFPTVPRFMILRLAYWVLLDLLRSSCFSLDTLDIVWLMVLVTTYGWTIFSFLPHYHSSFVPLDGIKRLGDGFLLIILLSSFCIVVWLLFGADNTLLDGWIDIMLASLLFSSVYSLASCRIFC
jgi:hypothetical protein